jgi:Carboxypeptidase regulatory-like domain
MKFLGACLLANSALIAQIVEGSVFNSATGAPIGGASIQISGSQISGSEGATYRATSDAQGAFRFDGVADGTYKAELAKSGFRTNRDAPALRPFRVLAGLNSVRLELLMVPQGTLSGRVLDGHDQPVAGAEISLLQDGAVGSITVSDEKGAFSFVGVRPGSYFLSARPPGGLKPPTADREQGYGWVPTWFPGVDEPTAAAKLLVLPGAELSGQDIKLLARPLHSLRGMVRDANGDPAAKRLITLNESFGLKPMEVHAASAKDGTFEVVELHDGTWSLSAEAENDGVTLRGFATVTLHGRDVEGVELRLTRPFSIPVESVLEKADSSAPIAGGVLLVPQLWLGRVGRVAPVALDGHKIQDVYPGVYKVIPLPREGPYYLASVQLGERDVLGQTVELNSPVPLKIVYRSDGGTIRGTVESCGDATILLAPQDPLLQRPEYNTFPRARCNADGRFEIRNLRPGRYYAFAFDQLEQSGQGVLSKLPALINQAVSVEVGAKDVASVELKVTAMIR